MTLSDYQKQFGVSYSHIARHCGCTQSAISQIANGSLKPSYNLAILIETATNGHVSRENWFPNKASPVSIIIGVTL